MYECSNILKTAIQTCQAYHENAFMSGEVPPVAFIFYAKNYYGMKDQTDVRDRPYHWCNITHHRLCAHHFCRQNWIFRIKQTQIKV
mgnify:CR=1 FL=1